MVGEFTPQKLADSMSQVFWWFFLFNFGGQIIKNLSAHIMSSFSSWNLQPDWRTQALNKHLN